MLRRIGTALLLGLLAQGGAPGAGAQTRQIVPIPFNDAATTEVDVKLSPQEPRIGAMAAICFGASRAGFITLWNIATNATVTRVFPNTYVQAEPQDRTAMRVEPTRKACVGAGGDSFRFRVDGPPGTEDLYLLWTARPELQPRGDAFPDAQAFAATLDRLGEAGRSEWAVAKTTYDIVPPAGGAPPAIPPRPGTGSVVPQQPTQQEADAGKPKLLILAMGANVGELTKTNQDAKLFAGVMAETFSVPEGDVRVIENATKTDFRNGLEWLRGRATPRDFVFVYFSGHGSQVNDPTGTSSDGKDELLIPYDFERKRPGAARDAVFSQELSRWINALPTRNVVTVLDTCHSAGLYRSIEADVLGARSKLYRLPADTDMTRPEGLDAPVTRAAGGAGRVQANGVLFAAAKRDQNALEGEKGGLFTLALLREIVAAREGTLADAFDRASIKTRETTRNRQNPESVGPMDVPRHINLGR